MAPTEVWQGEFDGWLFGNGTVFGWPTDTDAIIGLEDSPEISGGNHQLPGEDGAAPGSRWLGGKQLILNFIVRGDEATLRAAVNDFKRATRKLRTADVERPLMLWLPEQGIVQINARPGVRALPINELFRLGAARAMVEFTATDPRLYSATLRRTQVGVFEPSGDGFAYGDHYPKDYGGSSTGGTVLVPNEGDDITWPRFVITGPSTGAVNVQQIENITDSVNIDLTSDGGLTISSGRTVVIETHPARRTVAFTDGASRWNTAAGNVWWPISPGGAQLRLRATGDTDGVVCTVETRDAYQ